MDYRTVQKCDLTRNRIDGGEPIDGYIYLVDVIVYWTRPEDDSWWIRAYLDPPPGAPTLAEGLILRMDETRSERELGDSGNPEVRRWQGTYAFPADGPDRPLESHVVNLAILRSGLDYARFALYQQNPEQGMSGGNVSGGVGIVAGISTDRRQILVEP